MVRRNLTALSATGARDNDPGPLQTKDEGAMADSWSDEEVRVLVGWTAQDFGASMILRLETVTDLPESAEDVLVSRLVMNEDQAVQLGNMLFEMAGRLPPKPGKPPLIDRLLSRKAD